MKNPVRSHAYSSHMKLHRSERRVVAMAVCKTVRCHCSSLHIKSHRSERRVINGCQGASKGLLLEVVPFGCHFAQLRAEVANNQLHKTVTLLRSGILCVSTFQSRHYTVTTKQKDMYVADVTPLASQPFDTLARLSVRCTRDVPDSGSNGFCANVFCVDATQCGESHST
jgi:hypothetical protein